MTDVPDRLAAALADRYRIERELGAGGMATVYLAEDLRHHRQVALKVLKPEIAATLGAGRFVREIEVAARLQHPNILPLLDSGEAGGFFFYVMPYVEGDSLRDRLARGGELPIPEAVRILVEVADALGHAHSHGVVHRDIKPDNVMLSGRHALVTDFGVAKAVTEATGHQVLTSTGVALGTPAYMAPEQATADPHQDHRVDIYALGVLGYELLTGRAPYQATTAAEMLAAHVTAEPEPLEKYRPTVSPALAQIILRCLAKKPADRWQSAEDLLQHLEPLATPSGGTTPTQTAPIGVMKARRRILTVAVGAAIIAAGAVAVLAYQLLRPKPLNITVSDLSQVTNAPGVEFQPALSPDGNEVAYVGGPLDERRVFLRSASNVTAGAAIRLGDTTLGSEWFPSWTPDGQSIRFFGCPHGAPGDNCSWMETGKLGGAVYAIPLPSAAAHDRGAAWSTDGAQVAFFRLDTIFVAATGGGRTRRIAAGPFGYSLAWSPDGGTLAWVSGLDYFLWQGGAWGGSAIWVVSAGGGIPRKVAEDNHLNQSPVWLDAKHLLFVSDRDGQRAVYEVEVGPDGARGQPRIVPGLVEPHTISYSIAARKLAYAKYSRQGNVFAYPLGRSTPILMRDGRPVTTGDLRIEWPEVSPDGKWLAYAADLRGRQDVYKMALTGGPPVLLTSGPAGGDCPRWSPDGREIAFYSSYGIGPHQIMVVPAAGGAAVALTNLPTGAGHPAWSPNGLQIAFQVELPATTNAPATSNIWLVSRDSTGGPWHQPVRLSDARCYVPDWAPDGTAIACIAGGRLRFISLRDGQAKDGDLLTSNHLTLGGVPRYSRDGRTIYCLSVDQSGRRGIWAVPVAGGRARLVIAEGGQRFGISAISESASELYFAVETDESNIWVAKLKW